jgi:hypothetical protein
VQAGDVDRLALPVGLAAAAVVAWRLGFCVSHDTRAQRDGAGGERATAACSADGTGTAEPG